MKYVFLALFALFYLGCIASCFNGPLRQRRPDITVWNSTEAEIVEYWDVAHRQWYLVCLLGFPAALLFIFWVTGAAK
jgi:hypothetical protein